MVRYMMRKLMVLLVLSTLSLGASAVMEYPQEQADSLRGLPVLTVVSADTITRIDPIADVVVPVPSQPQSPNVGKEPPIIISSSKSVGGSSLTVSEMKIVMNGGRNFDPITRTWGFREPFTGEKRNSFLLSWEAKRVKYGASGLPDGLRYSKQ